MAELLRRPAGYLRGLALAVRMGRGSLPATLAHLFYFAEAVIAGRWMLAGGYTHFHTHFSSTVGLLVTRIFPLTMSITIHGPEEFNDVAGFHLAEKVENSRLVVAISSYARSQVLRACPPSQWEKVVTLRLGVDGEVFEPRPEPAGGVPEILCVGRLAPVKAQYVLIEALRLLHDRGVPARLRLVGDGPDRALLEAAAAKMGLTGDVLFDGWRNQDEVRARYRQATLFAMASFAEGIPVVLMEAMAMQIPCVATRIMGIPELIEDGVSGLLVPPADAAPLADALERLLRDAALRDTLGRAGRRRVLDHFSLSANGDALGELFTRRLS
jgi:glycosyltransferase involved in cell wall biosynthesis